MIRRLGNRAQGNRGYINHDPGSNIQTPIAGPRQVQSFDYNANFGHIRTSPKPSDFISDFSTNFNKQDNMNERYQRGREHQNLISPLSIKNDGMSIMTDGKVLQS